jgi:23S rRNA pseudouridine2605 synthase
MTERVNKILANWGIASRRQAEKLILAGRVKLNGGIIALGAKANLNTDILEVDGVTITPKDRPEYIYLLLNKPLGVVSTCNDPQKRRTVLNLLPLELRQGQGIHPVGRLDANSTGALLLTNDGELTNALTHPRYHLPKTYQVWVKGYPPESMIDKWRKGVILDNKKTLPAQVEVIKQNAGQTLLQIVLTEGKKRQIRRVAELLGFPVISLHRIAIGSIQLKSLPLGKYRHLIQTEIIALKCQIKS